MNEQDLMLTTILKCRRVDLATQPVKLTKDQKAQFQHMLARRAKGEPLQYVLGNTEFYGVDLSVNHSVLIPRPETELLVESAIAQASKFKKGKCITVLDLGVGSGNISIAFAKNQSISLITAVDIDLDAIVTAHHNAHINTVDHKIKFIRKDMVKYLEKASSQNVRFDIIISNPPYIPTAQLTELPVDVQQEPQKALDGGNDGLKFYRPIIEYSHKLLNENGFLVLEIGDGQRASLEEIFNQYPQYGNIHYQKDYVGTDRIICAHKN